MDDPIDRFPFPKKLRGNVVCPGGDPRIHGYAVFADLAPNYRFSDTILLALTGELPDEVASRRFERALIGLSPIVVGDAPAHAAVLARLCGATDAAVASVAATTLAEQAAHLAGKHARWMQWLDSPAGDAPVEHAANDDEREQVRALLEDVPAVQADPSIEAALFALLHASGVRGGLAIVAALTCARLPCAIAEASAVQPTDFRTYPMDVPAFRYRDER